MVIDLPGPGWLVFDGAGRGNEFPVHEVLTTYLGSDNIEALLLTHPHLDHYRGMRELIDHEQLGPRIRRVGCVSALIDDHPTLTRHSFGVEVDERIWDSRVPGVLVEVGAARALLERIQSFWSDLARRLAVVEGPLPLDNPKVSARILAPTPTEIEAFFAPQGRRHRLRTHANQISGIVEIRFGNGRYLFTGDLSGASWTSLTEREPGLDHHRLLKLPHHGSQTAHPPEVLRTRGSNPRTWVLTPFNRGGASTRPPTLSGLSALLEYEAEVHMTAFPSAWRQSRPAPAQVRLDELGPAPLRLRSSTRLPRGLRPVSHRGVDRELRPRDCYWLFCFNETGQLTRSERGIVATRVVRNDSPGYGRSSAT